jgi:hypothetical protein
MEVPLEDKIVVEGNVSEVIDVYSKALEPIVKEELGKVIVVSDVQCENAESPISLT